MRDLFYVIVDLSTGQRVGPTSFLSRDDAELALDVIRQRAATKGGRVMERVDAWFVDEWIEDI